MCHGVSSVFAAETLLDQQSRHFLPSFLSTNQCRWGPLQANPYLQLHRSWLQICNAAPAAGAAAQHWRRGGGGAGRAAAGLPVERPRTCTIAQRRDRGAAAATRSGPNRQACSWKDIIVSVVSSLSQGNEIDTKLVLHISLCVDDGQGDHRCARHALYGQQEPNLRLRRQFAIKSWRGAVNKSFFALHNQHLPCLQLWRPGTLLGGARGRGQLQCG